MTVRQMDAPLPSPPVETGAAKTPATIVGNGVSDAQVPVIPTAPSAPTAPNALAEQVYQRLKSDIFSFRLLPGDRFSEHAIATFYGVSRTPMRDGLFRMQREGYLEVGFRRGWKVSPIDFDQMDQLYDLRIVLELAALDRILSADADHVALETLKAIWCVPVDERESDAVTMFGMDEDFHRRLVAATGNREMLRVHNEVTERIRIVRRLDFLKPRRTTATYDEHAKMLQLIERNRIQEASILLRAHITQSKMEVRKITLSMLAAARDSKLPFVS